MIGERIRHARSYHGWSQGQLAELIGVSQPAISQIEKTGMISPDNLERVAGITQFAPWWFEQGALPDLPEGTLRFRKRASSRKRDDETVRAHVKQAVEVLDRLEGMVRLPPVRIEPVMQSWQFDDDSIEEITAEVRERLGVGPVDPIPNLLRAIERAGIAVIGSAREIERHDAASYWSDIAFGRPLICYSRGVPGDRQRFNLAHEVGHLVLHQARAPEDAEVEAHRFAGSLLLPREAALAEIPTPVTLRGLVHVKARWGISVAALIKRSLDLRLIDTAKRTSLEKQISARGWRKNEPVNVPEERPTLVAKAIKAGTGLDRPQALSAEFGIPALAVRDLVAG